MAPPLFSKPTLQPCPSCGLHIRRSESSCPHCHASLGAASSTTVASLGRDLIMAAPLVVGLALSGCADDKDDGTSGAGSTSSTVTTSGATTSGTQGATSQSTMGGTATSVGTTTQGTSSSGFADEADYGVPDTGFDGTATDTGETTSGSGTGGTVGEPEYGVATTTGIEPLYGVGISDDPDGPKASKKTQ